MCNKFGKNRLLLFLEKEVYRLLIFLSNKKIRRGKSKRQAVANLSTKVTKVKKVKKLIKSS